MEELLSSVDRESALAVSKRVDNASIAELLAIEAEGASGHLGRAFNRASRLAFLWSEEATSLLLQNRSLTELPGIGPYLAERIGSWIRDPPSLPEPPGPRRDFLTLARARRILRRNSSWLSCVKGDLQMHTAWSDGSSSIGEMTKAARARGYQYIAK
jgi:hypothetical protein